MENSPATPMMAQFLQIKADHPDDLLFYRMGDFYEMFFDDAIAAAEALDIALTKRGKHKGQDIPMCGVPVHSAEGYFLTLIRKGFRVAVCEQLEDPSEAKKRGYKAVVKRGVVRLVTPGTLTEDSLLNARSHNFLCAYAEVRGKGALAWVDVSTGDFNVSICAPALLGPQLARLAPKELLYVPGEERLATIAEDAGIAATPLSRASFDSTAAVQRLCGLFEVQSLEGYGSFSRPELAAMGAIVDYLEITQKGKLPLLRPPVPEKPGRTMQIDAATRRNLELTRSLSGERAGSLLGVIDRTITGAGARLLERRLSSPSTDVAQINNRLDAISYFSENEPIASSCKTALRKTPDIERALSRLALDRGGPRDLAAIRSGLLRAGDIAVEASKGRLPGILKHSMASLLAGHDDLSGSLCARLVAEPPMLARDGGFVEMGYHAELDELRQLRDEGRRVISGLQVQYAKDTGVTSLKIKHNNVLGYFIETPAGHASKMMAAPLSETFIHRQTTANQLRFTSSELSELESKILTAGEKALAIERILFEEMRQLVLSHAAEISRAAKALAEIDLAVALADLANGENWVRPLLTNDKRFQIKGGRHPVVEDALKRSGGGSFIANDCELSPEGETAKPVWLLTGPNMAGKSTFLRQNALIVLLAQIGSYVPAQSAEIGIVEQLFSRVGASDDLARGRSTFMVEMVETAVILNQAGDKALVILDEIGRGTATYDGLSIAWASLEHLHDVNKCRTLFATHYHELTGLSAKLNGLLNATVSVREWDGDIIFLHEVRIGAADRSYGVQVARLAGLPIAVVDRARVILEALEKGDREAGGKSEKLFEDLPLFSAKPSAPPPNIPESQLDVRIAKVLPDELSPKEALALIYELKELADL